MPPEQFLDLAQLLFPADQRCGLEWQVVWMCVQRSERRKLQTKRWMNDLIDMLGSDQIAETVLSQGEERDFSPERIPD